MYKVIYNGQIIDLLTELTPFRYLPKANRFVKTDIMSANCIQASDGKTLYGLSGNHFPESFPYKVVTIKPITHEEYDTLHSLIATEIIPDEDVSIVRLRAKKIAELKSECNNAIATGICIKLSDQKYHKFELTIEDQLNLRAIELRLTPYSRDTIYHEKGCVCRAYCYDDMKTIIDKAYAHITYHTTYFNVAKYCINNMKTVQEIGQFHYGDVIPNEEYRMFLDTSINQ